MVSDQLRSTNSVGESSARLALPWHTMSPQGRTIATPARNHLTRRFFYLFRSVAGGGGRPRDSSLTSWYHP